jgi:hypothetical protein
MSCPNPLTKDYPSAAGGLERIGPLVADAHPDLVLSKRRLLKIESIECVRLKRESARQNLGFTSRPFVLCGLPVKRPAEGRLLHERRNGQFVLQVTGHPSYGLPCGQDRLVPIFLATLAIRQQTARITFDSAAEMLDTFGMQHGGSQYRRLIGAFQIPTDLETAKALSSSPAALDLFIWLSYRCFTARGRERVPLFGDFGLVSQLGSADYARPRKFREKLQGWLDLVRTMRLECPASIDPNGTGLFVDRANAVLPLGGSNARH